MAECMEYEEEENTQSSEEIRLVLIGKTGTGKSATGNSILGRREFKTAALRHSVTKTCNRQTTTILGKQVIVVDTPGLFDTDTEDEATEKEIAKFFTMTSPGPHAVILVSEVKRFCEEDRQAFESFSQIFGENVINFVIVVFTGADALEDEKENFDDFLKGLPAAQIEFLEKCGNRYLPFNNTSIENEKDRQSLIKMIDELKKSNDGKSYNHKLYSKTESQLVSEEERMKEGIKKDYENQKKQIIDEINEKYRELEEKLKQKEDYIKQQLTIEKQGSTNMETAVPVSEANIVLDCDENSSSDEISPSSKQLKTELNLEMPGEEALEQPTDAKAQLINEMKCDENSSSDEIFPSTKQLKTELNLERPEGEASEQLTDAKRTQLKTELNFEMSKEEALEQPADAKTQLMNEMKEKVEEMKCDENSSSDEIFPSTKQLKTELNLERPEEEALEHWTDAKRTQLINEIKKIEEERRMLPEKKNQEITNQLASLEERYNQLIQPLNLRDRIAENNSFIDGLLRVLKNVGFKISDILQKL